MKTHLPLLLALLALTARVLAADAEEDWRAVAALDAGPREKTAEPAEAARIARTHLARQIDVLRGFLAAHAQDRRTFEARLRLSRALQIRADIENDNAPREEAARLLDSLAAGPLTAEQRTELDFARVTHEMRGLRTAGQRAALLNSARKFHDDHVHDRRVPALLAEIANLFRREPETMRALLLDARKLAKEEELRLRIADDLKRLDLLGKPVSIEGSAPDGRTLKLEKLRGRPAVVIFFATWSPPSIATLGQVNDALVDLPRGSVGLFGVSLDTDRKRLASQLEKAGITWPVVCDGKSWDSLAVSALGINALPTVWLLDSAGRLQSLDAAEDTAEQVKALLPAQQDGK